MARTASPLPHLAICTAYSCQRDGWFLLTGFGRRHQGLIQRPSPSRLLWRSDPRSFVPRMQRNVNLNVTPAEFSTGTNVVFICCWVLTSNDTYKIAPSALASKAEKSHQTICQQFEPTAHLSSLIDTREFAEWCKKNNLKKACLLWRSGDVWLQQTSVAFFI